MMGSEILMKQPDNALSILRHFGGNDDADNITGRAECSPERDTFMVRMPLLENVIIVAALIRSPIGMARHESPSSVRLKRHLTTHGGLASARTGHYYRIK